MIFNDLKKWLPEYNIKKMTDKENEDLYRLQQTNPYYFSCEQDHPVTYDEATAGVVALPPNVKCEQKFYIGFYKNGQLEAIMDYIEDYPIQDTVFIGLFMIDGQERRKGIGSKIVGHYMEVLRKNQVKKVRLGCIAENRESFPFWKSMGFEEVDRVCTKEEGRKDWNIIVMQKVL